MAGTTDPKNGQEWMPSSIEQDMISRLQYHYQNYEITPMMRDNIKMLAQGYQDASNNIQRSLNGVEDKDFAAPLGTDNVAKRLAFQRMQNLIDNANPTALRELNEPGAAETTWKLMEATDTVQYLGAHGHEKSNIVRLLNADSNQEVQKNVFDETKEKQEEIRSEVERQLISYESFRQMNRALGGKLEPGQKPLGNLMYLDDSAILPLTRAVEDTDPRVMQQRKAFTAAVSRQNTQEETEQKIRDAMEIAEITAPGLQM